MNIKSSIFPVTLEATFGDRVRYNEPLAGHTTLRLGGPAEMWLAVESVTELVTAVTLARQHHVSVFMLGSGANLLISDAGIRGLVIENRASRLDFPSLSRPVDGEGKGRVIADSGVVLPNLARRCTKRGLSGLEWAVGVPGTVGGAVVNNAGAYDSDMAHTLIRAELLSPIGERVWQPVEWFENGYRTSRLKKVSVPSRGSGVRGQGLEVRGQGVATCGQPLAACPATPERGSVEWVGGQGRDWIVLRAELCLTPAPVAEIEARMAEFNQRRKASQPPGATIGSMFKNPLGDYAGRLIEAAGLKGFRIGQAQISPIHANFFQNLGGATAAEVLELIRVAQEAVEAKFGVQLELEIEVVGEGEDKQ